MHLITPVTDIAYSSHYKNGNVIRLAKSCAAHNIKLNMVGLGETYFEFFKNHCLYRYIKDLDDNDIICIIDAYDMYLVSSEEEIESKFLWYESPIVVSVDTICYPDEALIPLFPEKKGIFKYINLGGIMGYVKPLKEALNKIFIYEQKIVDEGINWNCLDQLAWQWYFLYDQKDVIKIDYDCHLWQTLYVHEKWDWITKYKNRYQNHITNSFPCFIHGAGTYGLKKMEKLLNE
jgi:hypothetical protein